MSTQNLAITALEFCETCLEWRGAIIKHGLVRKGDGSKNPLCFTVLDNVIEKVNNWLCDIVRDKNKTRKTPLAYGWEIDFVPASILSPAQYHASIYDATKRETLAIGASHDLAQSLFHACIKLKHMLTQQEAGRTDAR